MPDIIVTKCYSDIVLLSLSYKLLRLNNKESIFSHINFFPEPPNKITGA